MNRRASLPGADELFRPTAGRVTPLRQDRPDRFDGGGEPAPDTGPLVPRSESPGGRNAMPVLAPDDASGRVRHDVKITVYLTDQELLDLEQARLRLRAEFGLRVDRGRIVREAVADLLGDLADTGPDARVVRRLT